MTKTTRIITGFLGVSMLMFGILKFIDPFKSWYSSQIIKSELPFPMLSYWSGQIGELIVGIILTYISLFSANLKQRAQSRTFVIAHLIVIVMMLVAFYVHLHPNVPAEILPLKISLPFIPGVFLVLAILNLYINRGALGSDEKVSYRE